MNPTEKHKKPLTPKVHKAYVPKYQVKAEGDDASEYDFVAERITEYKAEFKESLAHLVSTSLGSFVVCLNELYLRNGLIGSMITNVILSCIMSYCLYIIIARALDEMLFGKIGVYISPNNMWIYLKALFVPILLICMLTSTEYTAPYFYISHVFMVLTCIFILGIGTQKAPRPFLSYRIFTNTTSFFSLCGGCAFTMDSTSAILTVENNMNAPRKIYLVIIIAPMYAGMSIVTALVMAVSVVGGFSWGYGSQAPITVNFGMVSYAPLFRAGIVFITYTSFSLEFWVLFNLLWIHLKKNHAEEQFWIFERLYRAAFVLAITVFALTFPDLSGLMSFFGAITVGVLNFIFPPVIEFLVDVRFKGFGKFKWKLIRLIAITSFGTIIVIGGVFSGSAYTLYKVFGVTLI